MKARTFEGSDILSKYHALCYNLSIMIVYDWKEWQEGINILNGTTDINAIDEMDIVSLCKLLTMINRADKFNDGLMADCFANGLILRILRALVVSFGVQNLTNNDGK